MVVQRDKPNYRPSMSVRPHINVRDWGLIAILSLLWGGTFLLIEIGLKSFPPVTLVFIRMGFAVPPLLLATWLSGERLPQDFKSWRMLTAVGMLNGGLPFMLFFWGQQYLDSGYASILNATTPLWGVLVAHFMTQDEKATPARIAGVLLGMAGIVIMVGASLGKGMSQSFIAQLACLVSTLFYSFAAVYGRRLSQAKMSPMVIATGQTAMAALFLLPAMLVIDQPWTLPPPRLDAVLAGAAIAVLSTALAYVFYFRLIDSAGASNAQLVAFIMPVVAVFLGVAVLGERLSERQLAGSLVIALGLAVIDGRLLPRSQKAKA